MKITSLEVHNLFSFDDFQLAFDDRLTVLVGPNGAGKTNVVRVLELIAALVEWADERSYSASPIPSPLETTPSSFVRAKHDASAPATPLAIRLGVELTTPAERERFVVFFRAALLATLFDEWQGLNEDKKAQLASWVTTEIAPETLHSLFTGTLSFRHPGYQHTLWEARYEFNVAGSCYDWVLATPDHRGSIVAHDTPIDSAIPKTTLHETLFPALGNSGSPPPLPASFPPFTLSALCPPPGRQLTDLFVPSGSVIALARHAPFRAAADLLGREVFGGASHRTFGLARVFHLNLADGLVILGEQFRGLGDADAIPWRAETYPPKPFVGPVPRRNPGLLPLRLFQLKNGVTPHQREAFAAIREQFERLAPGRAFDVTLSGTETPVVATAPIAIGHAAEAGGGNEEPAADRLPDISVIGWNKDDDRTPRRERPIRLFGAGTWEALVLAEALVSASDRLTVLDEPGASLHPTWQTALRRALQTVPGQVLLVTHSPHLVPMEEADDLKRLVRISHDGRGSRCRRLPRTLGDSDVAKITQELSLSADARALLFCRGAVIVSGPTEQGALPIWCRKSSTADQHGTPAARDIEFYSIPGDSGYRTVLSVLHEFGIPWVVVCDGKSFDVETNWSNHIFRQIQQAGIDFPELKAFTDRMGSGGKRTRRMSKVMWSEQIDLGARHGIFTLTTSWTAGGEDFESFIERVAPGRLAEAFSEVGKSKIRQGRWVALQTDCPSEVDDLYRRIIATLDRVPIDVPGSGRSPSGLDGTVTR